MLHDGSRTWTDPQVTSIGRLPISTPLVPFPTAAEADPDDPSASPWWRSLDGTWQFHLARRPDQVPRGFESPGFDDTGWEQISVPGAWTTQALARTDRSRWFDLPHYTNVQMPFDCEPPGVPEDNPTGAYRTSFSVPRNWAGRRVVLRLGAAESAAYLWVNGALVGMATDSRLPSEFDITAHVRAGRRATVAVAVVKWSAATWVEDQDQWWHGGIQRSVTVPATAPSYLASTWLVPGLADDLTTGTLDVDVQVDGPARREHGWTVEVAVATPRGRRLATTGRLATGVWDGSSPAAATISAMFTEPGRARTRLEVPGVRPWSHEDPQRYRVTVELRDPSGAVVEAGARWTGFRSVVVRDRALLVNGQPVELHGVNLHEHDPSLGRAVTREQTRLDLLLMKAHHLNAVRAAHYPHDEHLAELCDELGLYLVDEANVETHARQASLCHDPRFDGVVEERVRRMVQRDAAHPSIIMWSLGNESGYGPAHDAAAAWVRRTDPSRPLHYEGPLMHDLAAEAPVTDVVCPMYPSIDDAVARAALVTDDRRPVVLCEYSHAMGNSSGSLADYRRAVRETPGFQGGFIWEWLEHGLPLQGRTGPSGRPVWGYGGDFGDDPHDANFVCDGLVAADRMTYPELAEVRWLGRPVEVVPVDAGRGRVRITSHRWFTTLADLRGRWRVEVDGTTVATGTLDVADLGAQSSRVVDLSADPAWVRPAGPPGAAATLSVEWVQRRATEWFPAGSLVGWDQMPVPVRTSHTAVPVPRARALVPVGERTVDQAPWAPTVYRALTDNDGLRVGWLRGIQGQVLRWVDTLGLDRVDWVHSPPRRRRAGDDVVTTTTGELRLAGAAPAVRVRHRTVARPDGWTLLDVVLTVPPALTDLPRVGLELELPGTWEHLEWQGDGPHESYPDRCASVRHGRWTSTVSDQYVDFVVPQEHGRHGGLDWVAVRDDRCGLLVVARREGLSFTARHHADAELWAATHTDDLSPLAGAARTWLYVDAAHRGLGTAACGPDALDRYRVGAGRFTVSTWCRDLGPGDDAAAWAAVARAGALDG
ncbi:MAG: glycoside hydrolase family 2 TIM barrel-domain containing protein [Actinomycetes bacterium]